MALSGATDITYTPSPTPVVDTYHAEVSSIVEVERCRTAAGRRIAAVCCMVAHGVQHTRIAIGVWAMWLNMCWAAAIARLHLCN